MDSSFILLLSFFSQLNAKDGERNQAIEIVPSFHYDDETSGYGIDLNYIFYRKDHLDQLATVNYNNFYDNCIASLMYGVRLKPINFEEFSFFLQARGGIMITSSHILPDFDADASAGILFHLAKGDIVTSFGYSGGLYYEIGIGYSYSF